jgi:hypothetical protein
VEIKIGVTFDVLPTVKIYICVLAVKENHNKMTGLTLSTLLRNILLSVHSAVSHLHRHPLILCRHISYKLSAPISDIDSECLFLTS